MTQHRLVGFHRVQAGPVELGQPHVTQDNDLGVVLRMLELVRQIPPLIFVADMLLPLGASLSTAGHHDPLLLHQVLVLGDFLKFHVELRQLGGVQAGRSSRSAPPASSDAHRSDLCAWVTGREMQIQHLPPAHNQPHPCPRGTVE